MIYQVVTTKKPLFNSNGKILIQYLSMRKGRQNLLAFNFRQQEEFKSEGNKVNEKNK